ncbi:MAG: isoprenyl transferase [Candidatus Acetothermia bacterium]|jgi:undecaprenyl diphosphate synthase|nr:isoprenyl transferase [Candidatus Acetothermia bacterium]MDH7504558.1 isoprenyl transferase [Candidatus Acetothermia bacterium]
MGTTDPALAARIARAKARGLPQHLAIIMDGNGRWARRRGEERRAGHRAGLETARKIVEFVGRELGIKYLTLFVFSKENWRRPKEEVDFLMGLLADFLRQNLDELLKGGVRLQVLGDLDGLPERVRAELERAVDLSRANDKLYLSLAINYGGRQEILRAVRLLLRDLWARGQPGEIDEPLFRRYLYTAELPDPDLLIRTSGEERISNFLLWQSAYAEFWVTETLWPDFSVEELLQAVEDFQSRQRKFGGVVEG